jgi:hypothetical protein
MITGSRSVRGDYRRGSCKKQTCGRVAEGGSGKESITFGANFVEATAEKDDKA